MAVFSVSKLPTSKEEKNANIKYVVVSDSYPHFQYKVEGKIIPETGQQDIKASCEILLDFGVAIRSSKLKELESIIEKRYSWRGIRITTIE